MRRRTIQIMELIAIIFAALLITCSVITASDTISYITIISKEAGLKEIMLEILSSIEVFGIGLVLLAASGILHILAHVGK